MAAKSSSALKKLEEQLTCSVCLDQLTDPKTLSCLHSFCHTCLEKLTDYNNDIRCPTCRSEFELGDEGVHSLQTSFLVNNLMEVHDMLKKVSHDKLVLCDVCGESFSTGYCQHCESFTCDTCLEFHNKWKKNSTHRVFTLQELADSAYDIPRAKSQVIMKCSGHNKPLDIFCETCDQLVCQHCTVKIHRDHEYDVLSDVYDGQCEAIKDSIVPVDSSIEECQAMIEQVDTDIDKLKDKGDKVKEAIQERVSQIMDMFFVTADKLSKQVDCEITKEEHRLGERRGQIKNVMDRLSACKDHVEQSLSIGSQQQVLASKTQLIEHAHGVVGDCDISGFRQQQEEFVIELKQSVVRDSPSIGEIHVCYELLVKEPNKEPECEIEMLVPIIASPNKSSVDDTSLIPFMLESSPKECDIEFSSLVEPTCTIDEDDSLIDDSLIDDSLPDITDFMLEREQPQIPTCTSSVVSPALDILQENEASKKQDEPLEKSPELFQKVHKFNEHRGRRRIRNFRI